MPCLLLHLVPPCLTLPFFALKGYDLRFRPGSRFFIRTLSLKFSPVYYNSKLILEPASLAQLPSKFPLKHPGCRAGSHSSTMAGSSYHRRTFKEQVTSSSPSSSVFFPAGPDPIHQAAHQLFDDHYLTRGGNDLNKQIPRSL